MDKPVKVSKYLITEGRYLRDDVDSEQIRIRREDPALRHLLSEDDGDHCQWVPDQMINLDEIRTYNPTKLIEGEVATKVVFNNGDTETIRLKPDQLLDKLIERENFLYDYNLYLGEVKLGKNKSL